jgi:hypothetical protein
MKTLAIIFGTLIAVVVLTVATIATVLYINAEEEEFSRGEVDAVVNVRIRSV